MHDDEDERRENEKKGDPGELGDMHDDEDERRENEQKGELGKQAAVMEEDAGKGQRGREDAGENEQKGELGKRGLDGPNGTSVGQARERKKLKQNFTSRDSRLQQTRIQSGRAGEGWRWLQEARARSAADSTWLQRCIAQEVSREWEDRWHAQQEMAAMLLLLLLSLQGFFPAKSAG
jgi:hypothetical protein